MRVTAETKEVTRRRILDEAVRLFARNGFDGTTTREIAVAAGIATGTVFNYFPSKEAVVGELVLQAFITAEAECRARRTGLETLVEDLFSLAAISFRQLRSHRAYLGAALDAVFAPANQAGGDPRTCHLESVSAVLRDHGIDPAESFITLTIYWSLFVGLIAFWCRDDSPNQEDSLVLMDRSLQLFVSSVSPGTKLMEVTHGA